MHLVFFRMQKQVQKPDLSPLTDTAQVLRSQGKPCCAASQGLASKWVAVPRVGSILKKFPTTSLTDGHMRWRVWGVCASVCACLNEPRGKFRDSTKAKAAGDGGGRCPVGTRGLQGGGGGQLLLLNSTIRIPWTVRKQGREASCK